MKNRSGDQSQFHMAFFFFFFPRSFTSLRECVPSDSTTSHTVDFSLGRTLSNNNNHHEMARKIRWCLYLI